MARQAEYWRTIKQERLAGGICVRCGKAPANGGRQKCERCRSQAKAEHARVRTEVSSRRLERARLSVQNGLCGRCHKSPHLSYLKGKRNDPEVVCDECYLKRIAYKRCGATELWPVLKAKWDLQEGRCAYTGAKLFLGMNASLDHIMPVSRSPDQEITIDAIDWVTFQVNEFKAGKTKDEFVRLVAAVYENSHLHLQRVDVPPPADEGAAMLVGAERHWKLRAGAK